MKPSSVHGRTDHRDSGSMRPERRRPTCVVSMGSAARRSTNGKAKYGGLDVSEAKRLKSLADENAKLKRLLAEAVLDNAMLKDIATKKW